MAERERRVMLNMAEYRKEGDGPTEIRGMGALYNEETVVAGFFREIILPGAFRAAVKDDIRVLYNHDPNIVLGRTTSGTAEVRDTKEGMAYSATVNPRDSQAMDVAARIERGDVTGSSFSFTIDNPDDEEWVRDDKAKLPLRQIKRATVYDVGPVTFPQYEATSVSARSKERAAAITADEAAKAAAVKAVPALDEARAKLEAIRRWQQSR